LRERNTERTQMYDFDSLIGEEHLKSKMKAVANSGKHSHAYLIVGEKRSGKTTLANCFAKALQCESEGNKPCGMCLSCMQMDAGNHPDVITLQSEKEDSIGIRDIREGLNNDIVIKPYRSEKKVYIIDDAQKMTRQAQNALLKTLEEPPSYAVIIMTTTSAEAMLQTVLSRTIVLPVRPVPDEQIRRYLMHKAEIPDYRADVFTAFARGNLGKAMDLATSSEFEESKEKAVALLKGIEEKPYPTLYVTAAELTEKKKSENLTELMDFIRIWYRDALVYKSTLREEGLIFREEIQYIKKVSKEISYEGFEDIFKALKKSQAMLRSNVNAETVADLLLIAVKDCRKEPED